MVKKIKSAIYYTGNKFRLVEQLLPLFPKNIDLFVDAFGGSGVVSLNVDSKQTWYNEFDPHTFRLYNLLRDTDPNVIINHIKERIKQFNLQKGKEKTDIGKPEYYAFRDYINQETKTNGYLSYLDAYALSYYAFCTSLRFDQKAEDNLKADVISTYGNREFNDGKSKAGKIIAHYNRLKEKNFYETTNFEIINLINKLLMNEHTLANRTFIYFDPPYLDTITTYNGGWDNEKEQHFKEMLYKLDLAGFKWGLSNIERPDLIEWANENGYTIKYLDIKYVSNGAGLKNHKEVYITNYKSE